MAQHLPVSVRVPIEADNPSICREQPLCWHQDREADEEGYHELAERFRKVDAIEKRREERCRKLLNDGKMEQMFEKSSLTIRECRVCGRIVVGSKAPEVCPVCKYSQSCFEATKSEGNTAEFTADALRTAPTAAAHHLRCKNAR